jgi:hypothetical protein
MQDDTLTPLRLGNGPGTREDDSGMPRFCINLLTFLDRDVKFLVNAEDRATGITEIDKAAGVEAAYKLENTEAATSNSGFGKVVLIPYTV